MRVKDFLHSDTVHLAILRAAALLVPSRARDEWFAEWRSELWYASRRCSCESATLLWHRGHVTAFCLGSFKDALWLRRNTSRSEEGVMLRLESPSKCLAFLAALAALSAIVAFLLMPGAHDSVLSVDLYQPFVPFLFVLIFACSALPATTSLSLGELPSKDKFPHRGASLRCWLFLSSKIAFILLMVYCELNILAYSSSRFIRAASPLLIHFILWSCVFALRWALIDQRRRCPVCLRLLTNPVWVGNRSRYFLEWNCVELMCLRGHGLLYIPEHPASWFSTQRWLPLDPS